MPDTDSLGRRVLDIQRSIHESPPRTHSDNCDGISSDSPVLVEGSWPAASFEVWLSRLAEPQPYLHGPQNSERQALYDKLVPLIVQEIDSLAAWVMRSDPPDWLMSLVQQWMADGTPVVTLNYDTFVEATVDALLVNRRENRAAKAVAFQLKPHLLRLDYPESALGGSNMPMPTSPFYNPTEMSLYKLHGSTRWFWDDFTRSTDSMVGIGQWSGWYLNQGAVDISVPGKVPVIVPPTTTKSAFFTNWIIRELWRGAYHSLRRADRIFVLGYSLPQADLVVQYLLTESLAVKRPELWLVNRSSATPLNYGHLGITLNTEFCDADSPIPRFVEWYLADHS